MLTKYAARDEDDNSDLSSAAGLLGEMALMAAAPAAPAPALAPAFNVGDEVRGKLPSGAMFNGAVVSLTGDKVVVQNEKGIKRELPVGSLQSQGDVNQAVTDNKHQLRKDQENDRLNHKQNQKNERIENSVIVTDAKGSPEQLAPVLEANGYKLFLTYRDSSHLERAEMEYALWTGGEQLPDEAAKQHDTAYVDEWHLEYDDKENFSQEYGFFNVEPSGRTGANWKKGPAIGYSTRSKVRVQRREIIEPLVRAGLRATGGTAELHASSMEPKPTSDGASGSHGGTDIDGHTPLISAVGGYSDEEIRDPKKMKWLPYQRDGKNYWMDAYGVEHESKGQKQSGFNQFSPAGQVVTEFYPELQHEIIDYPNANNSPMIEDIDITNGFDANVAAALESSLDTTKISYVSTSPAGIGRDGKPQVLEGTPLRKENDIRGGMFMDEFHQNYEGGPDASALSIVSTKVAAAEEANQFAKFLARVCGEIAAAMGTAFKVTMRPILGKVPGSGQVQLAEIERSQPGFYPSSDTNLIDTASRVRYLLEKLTDSEVQDAINKARAQQAVWCEDSKSGFIYEVFVRAESIDTDTMVMTYEFVTGSKEAE